MRTFQSISRPLLLAAGLVCAALPASAAEGTTAAGPIGGSDMRSALLPPPGLYGVAVGLYSTVDSVHDGTGHPVPAFDAVDLKAEIGGALVLYVPDVKVLGGSIGFIGFLDGGQECGQLVSFVARQCTQGLGDPYVEADW